MKRGARADEALARLNDADFRAKLEAAIEAREKASRDAGTPVEITGHDVRALALDLVPFGTLDGVKVSFHWDPDARRVEVLVKGASVPVDEQTEARG